MDQDFRGQGIGKELLRRLEADARIKGFRYAILETGELYADMTESLCMKKKL